MTPVIQMSSWRQCECCQGNSTTYISTIFLEHIAFWTLSVFWSPCCFLFYLHADIFAAFSLKLVFSDGLYPECVHFELQVEIAHEIAVSRQQEKHRFPTVN